MHRGLQLYVLQAATLLIPGCNPTYPRLQPYLSQERGDDPTQRSLHLVLHGNPGTGKTRLAALYAQLLGELKVLPEGRVTRVTGAQL